MNDTPSKDLNNRLVELTARYPDCSWLKDFLQMNLKNFPRPLTRVNINNDQVDIPYEMFFSEN